MKPTQKILAVVLSGAAALAATAALALPGEAKVERSIEIASPPAPLFALINSPMGFDQFNPFRAGDPGLKTAYEGPDAGPGATLRWTGKQGAGTQTIVEAQENVRVDMVLELGPIGRPSQSFLLEPTPAGTRVTWTTTARFGPNPVQRLIGLGMNGMLGPVYQRGLNDLKTLAEGQSPLNLTHKE